MRFEPLKQACFRASMLFCMWAVETAVLGRACPARRACCSFCSTCAHMSCEVHTATCTYSACADSTQRGPRRGVCSQPRGSPWHRMARLVPFTKSTCFSAVSGAALRARNSVTHTRTHARTHQNSPRPSSLGHATLHGAMCPPRSSTTRPSQRTPARRTGHRPHSELRTARC